MTIQGQFRNNNNELITMVITTNKGSGNLVIGENGLFFGDTPIVITQELDDTFEPIIRKSATINLVTKNYLGNELFSYNARDIEITISKGNNILFWGYVEPNSFNQPFIGLDEFSLTAVDYLCTLDYFNYKNVTVNDYDTKKATADNISFRDIISTILPTNKNIYYDISRGLTSNRTNYIFDDLSISEMVMYGKDADDIWTQKDTLESMLRYLNLHIIQWGDNFYIFDWDTIKNQRRTWYNLRSKAIVSIIPNVINIDKDTFAANDTNITISDVYNQISVKCDLEEQDTLIESPLNKDSLNSLYSGKQLYMTEYISEGSGDSASGAFNNIVRGQSTNYKDSKVVHWYMQVMTNPNWKLNTSNGTIDNLFESDSLGYVNQWKVPKYLRDNSCTPALIRMGSYEIKQGESTDNSPISKVDMKDYLFISVNGNETSSETEHLPSDATLRDKAPIIEYVSNNSGGVFSPTDNNTTNYLVFSGKILLQPIQYESSTTTANKLNNYADIYTNGVHKTEGTKAQRPNYDEGNGLYLSNLVKSDNNDEGRYYTRKFYNQYRPSDEVSTYLSAPSLQPWTTDKSAHGYKFNYSAKGDGSDKFSKLPILECELIIGNKRLIETNIDEYGNSTFEWVTVGQEPSETVDGVSYKITTFSLGINPKINDYIIGDEFNIQNTIKYQMNLDAEGTAIPIKRSDKLSGKVQFKILGAVNTLWNDVTRRHPSFWRHTKWYDNSRFILAHTENIIIKDFECKVYSDNGLIENSGDNELVYMSAETNNFINKKDDIEFKFITQLSSAECLEKGIKSTVNLNSVISTSESLPITNIYNSNTNETAKAEEHYINQYYLAYSTPKILLQTTVHKNNLVPNDIYKWTTLNNKTFFIMSSETDLKYNRATLTLKEI